MKCIGIGSDAGAHRVASQNCLQIIGAVRFQASFGQTSEQLAQAWFGSRQFQYAATEAHAHLHAVMSKVGPLKTEVDVVGEAHFRDAEIGDLVTFQNSAGRANR